jgi:hypothetical protein
MSDRQRDKQALEEMDRALGDTMAKSGQPTDQAVAAGNKITPYEEFRQLVTDLQATARQQQLKTEQAIQQTLQQAATALSDAQKTDLIMQQLQLLQQGLSQQNPDNNSPQQYQQILRQLATQVGEQLYQADQQALQALQQTVSSIAQSQSAMFDSQAYARVSEILKQCEKTLQQWQNPPRDTVH